MLISYCAFQSLVSNNSPPFLLLFFSPLFSFLATWVFGPVVISFPKSPPLWGCGFDPRDLQNICVCEFRLEFLLYLKKKKKYSPSCCYSCSNLSSPFLNFANLLLCHINHLFPTIPLHFFFGLFLISIIPHLTITLPQIIHFTFWIFLISYCVTFVTCFEQFPSIIFWFFFFSRLFPTLLLLYLQPFISIFFLLFFSPFFFSYKFIITKLLNVRIPLWPSESVSLHSFIISIRFH